MLQQKRLIIWLDVIKKLRSVTDKKKKCLWGTSCERKRDSVSFEIESRLPRDKRRD